MGDTYSLHQCGWNDGYQNKSFFWGEGTEVGRTDKGGSQISHANKSSMACQCSAM